MRFLILGGTGFLGYHAVAAALQAGHEVSAFSREGDAPLPGVEPLRGDREGNLSALRGREWDAVLDTFSGPGAVGETARLLSGHAGTYGYVSGISNYHPDGPAVVDENSPLRSPDDSRDDPLQERSAAKILCERAVEHGFSGNVLIVRPGIMVGPRDPTDRFTYWPLRFARALSGDGREVLAPGDPGRYVQYTDARDLAAWIVGMLGSGASGTYNGVGPGYEIPLADVLAACLKAAAEETGTDGSGSMRLTWASEAFLERELSGVTEEERPLWFPERQIPFDGVDSSRAAADGLRFRTAYETARDTLAWARSRPQSYDLRAGFSPEFERTLLERWGSDAASN